jgi:hypothetical protein
MNLKEIKAEVYAQGSCVVLLPKRTAKRTIAALQSDGYGPDFLFRDLDGNEGWRVYGEPDPYAK